MCQVVAGLCDLGYSSRRSCRIVGLSRSTFFDNKFRHPSSREIRRLLLSDVIAEIHSSSRGTYGKRRIRATLLIERDLIVNPKLVARIMADLGIYGLPRKKAGIRNLVNVATSSDLIKRNFTAQGPNQIWLTDITEHPTREGKLYCCVVLDVFSRAVVGWSIDRHQDTDMVNDAINMAARERLRDKGVILHSDHGTQFTSWSFSQNIERLGLVGSMGSIGDCFDNAPMEAFWGRMQVELLNRKKWTTVVELSIAMADYIVNFYNVERRHSALGYLTPVEFEAVELSKNPFILT